MTSRARPVVTTDWLAEHAADPDVVVAAVDEDATAYHRSHIPGAVSFDWSDDFQDRRRHSFCDRHNFGRLLETRGIDRNTHVVVYSSSHAGWAAYAYWYLRYYGHPRASLLDGGRRLWERQGRPLTAAETPVAPPRVYVAPPGDERIRARRDDVLGEFVGAPAGKVLIDCRSPAEFDGTVVAPEYLILERDRIGGHIPGAVNIPYAEALDPATGRFLPVERLRRFYAAHGVTADDDVVVYCRVGERSVLVWFVLSELLGFPRVRLYDGSWREYGSLVDVPIASGAW